MKIKSKLIVGILLTIAIFIAAATFVSQEVNDVSREVAKAKIAQEILQDRISRRTLLLEYIAYHEERPRDQWRLLSQDIESKRLEHIRFFNTSEEINIIHDIYDSTDLIGILFEKLTIEREAPDQGLADEFEIALIAQIETESLANTYRAKQLVINSLENIELAQRNLFFVIIAGLVTLFGFLAVLFISFSKSIARPLQSLVEVTKKFTVGNLEERVEVVSDDEIGELGVAFNEMAEKLQEMYVSLEKKVEDRTQDLEESRNRLSKLSERFIFATRSARIGVWEWDVVNNVLTWDDQMHALYGVDRESFGGAYDAWANGLHPDDKKNQEDEVKLALDGKKDLNTTFRVVWPSGEVHDIRAFATVERDAVGKPLKMVGVNWDVTKEMGVDKAKSEFVSLASHQLRTPLSTINWYAEMLESGDAGLLNEKQREFLKEIYVGSQRMVALVNALLNVSRLELGRLSVDPAPTDMVELAKTIISELKPLVEKNQITITERYGDDLPKANVDPKLVSIVFQNLLTNSVKYSREKGSVDFSIELKKAGNKVGERGVISDSFLIMVKDNGIGIPEGQQKAVFTKLFRADNARERDQDGTGLGLYLVKEIVDLAKGDVWYTSQEGEGTTFSILLPVEGMSKSFGKTSLK